MPLKLTSARPRLFTNVPAETGGGGSDPDLKRWASMRAGRLYTPADVMFTGDSHTEGQGATAFGRQFWARVRDNLRAKYPTPGIAGGVGFIKGSQNHASYPSPWTLSGTTSGATLGLGGLSAILFGPDGAMSIPVTGTSVVVEYIKSTGLGTFIVQVDGVTAATVNSATGAQGFFEGGGRQTVSLGTRGAHTVRIAYSAGNQSCINGIHVRDQDETAGIRVVENARAGARTRDWDPAFDTNVFTVGYSYTQLNPALVVIALGVNDYINGEPISAYKQYIRNHIAHIDSMTTNDPSLMFVSQYDAAVGFGIPWQKYVEGMQELSTEYGSRAGYVDFTPYFTDPTMGVRSGDNSHPSDRGAALMADLLVERL